MNSQEAMSVFLAEDDEDDCLLFNDAIKELSSLIQLRVANDGVELMDLLNDSTSPLPKVLFLDINMPRKNGFECLVEIRNNKKFDSIVIVICSTSFQRDIADQLYEGGAQYYIRKPAMFRDYKAAIKQALTIIQQNKQHPTKENFVIM